jgi:hypothetical protein
MSNKDTKNAVRNAPFAPDGTANTNVLDFSTGASLSNALPKSWRGRRVRIINQSNTAAELVYFLFAKAATTIVAPAPAADGQPGVAHPYTLAASSDDRRILECDIPAGDRENDDVFFCRLAASGTPAVTMLLLA